jgi:hypothetical protein
VFASTVEVGDRGIVIDTGTAAFNNTVTTYNGGGLAINNSDAMTFADIADLTLDGPFVQTGSGGITSGASIFITTPGDEISFEAQVILTESVVFSSGVAAGDVVLAGDVSGDVEVTITAGGDVVIGGMTVDVIDITSGGSVNEADPADEDADLSASTVTINADAGIGEIRDIEIDSPTIHLVSEAGTIDVNIVGQATDVTVTGASTTAGHVLVNQADGNLILPDGAFTDDGNILLAANGTLGFDADVSTLSGSISIQSGGTITQDADVLADGGTIDVRSAADDILMKAGVSAETNGGNIWYTAGGDILLAVIDARTEDDRENSTLTNQANWGDVALIAGGSILDNADAGDTDIDVYANKALFDAGLRIGEYGQIFNEIETEIVTVAASAGSGQILITDATSIVVGTIASVPVNRVQPDGTVEVVDLSAPGEGVTGGQTIITGLNDLDGVDGVGAVYVTVGEWDQLPMTLHAADSEFSTLHGAEKAVDGDPDTAWISARYIAPTEVAWTGDLGAVQTISRVRVLPFEAWSRNAPIDFTVQVSIDGVTFTDVAAVENEPVAEGRWTSTTFANAQARYVRIIATATPRSDGAHYLSFAEIEVYDALPVNQIRLTWQGITEGMDVGRYELRWSLTPIENQEDWEQADGEVLDANLPHTGGELHSTLVELNDLPLDSDIYFAIGAHDVDDIVFNLSNTYTLPTANSATPDAITDLRAIYEDDVIALSWTATGEDQMIGRLSGYEIRWSSDPIVSEADWQAATAVDHSIDPYGAGETESLDVSIVGLPVQSTVYFAVRGVDGDGSLSLLGPAAGVTTTEQIGFQVDFVAGWNLFSLPIAGSISAADVYAAGNVGAIYGLQGGEWTRPIELEGNAGYWAYAREAFTLSVIANVTGESGLELDAGVNLIGSLDLVDEVIGVAGIDSVIGWNADRQSWYYVANDSDLRQATGYFVVATTDVSLSFASDQGSAARSADTHSTAARSLTVTTAEDEMSEESDGETTATLPQSSVDLGTLADALLDPLTR